MQHACFVAAQDQPSWAIAPARYPNTNGIDPLRGSVLGVDPDQVRAQGHAPKQALSLEARVDAIRSLYQAKGLGLARGQDLVDGFGRIGDFHERRIFREGASRGRSH